eukprot:432915_1
MGNCCGSGESSHLAHILQSADRKQRKRSKNKELKNIDIIATVRVITIPSSLQECSKAELLYLFKNFIIDDEIDQYKQEIIAYIDTNNIDGQHITQIQREDFGQSISKYFDDENIIMAALRTYDNFQKFRFSALSSILPLHRLRVSDICGIIKKWVDIDNKNKAHSPVTNILSDDSVHRLIETLNHEKINGLKFIEMMAQNEINEMIKTATGWSDQNIEQIKLVLLKHNGFTKKAFIENMNDVLKNQSLLPNTIKNQIKDVLVDEEFDIEIIHHKIKNNKNIELFSDKIINFVGNLIDSDKDNCMVDSTYKAIAQCFVCNNTCELLLDKPRDWTCSNCGNYNFCKFINGKMNYNVSDCNLCGISQIDSVVLKLRNLDSFLMFHDSDIVTKDHDDDKNNDVKEDDIDELIQKAIKAYTINLVCLGRNDKKPCPSMLRLSKQLIKYKRCLKDISNKNVNINKTIEVDIGRYINDDLFKTTFENAKSLKKLKSEQLKTLLEMIQNNNEQIAQIQTFLNTNKKTWKSQIAEHTKIKLAPISRLYKEIDASLKKLAQEHQFGEFFANINMNQIDADYHHILKLHINNGNQTIIKNVFRFFSASVHFVEVHSEIENCVSVQRNIEREKQKKQKKPKNGDKNDEKMTEEKTKRNRNTAGDKDIWKYKQRYNQTQLDMYHSFLVHSTWKNMVKQYTDHNESKFSDQLGKQILDEKQIDLPQNRDDKYVLELDQFEFGVEFYHPDLLPIYPSVWWELMFNNIYALTETLFYNSLTNAIGKHAIALDKYADVLYCKYYDERFNIIRNELIGIRHIFALVVYTDLTDFCKAFRETYRKMNDETRQQLQQKHCQLYHYARCLYEAVDIFGQNMSDTMTVYHGLSVTLHFERFTSEFDQPMSTTSRKETAQQFSQGVGIILELKSGMNKTPKYLSVSWLSVFPHEEEELFYGSTVLLKIANIIDAETLTEHREELEMFNQFQRLIQNQIVEWNDDMIKQLTKCIQNQQMYVSKTSKSAEDPQNVTKYTQQTQKKKKYKSTKYGKDLFNFFC